MSTLNVLPLDTNRFVPDARFSQALENDLRLIYDAVGIHELEQTLRNKINDFQSQRGKHGYGYRALTAAIETKLYEYLEKQDLSAKAIESIIDKRVPSHTYIRKFKEGQNICINYMNTLAFFFGVKYLVNNFEFA